MIRALKRKLASINSHHDAVIVGDFPCLPEAWQRNQEKIEAAKASLGERYILHPANRVTKIMDDAAVDLRRQFIMSVK